MGGLAREELNPAGFELHEMVGGTGILELEVSVTDPPTQIELMEELTVTVGAALMVTEKMLLTAQLFASFTVTCLLYTSDAADE